MRVLHLTVLGELGSGVRKQLSFEVTSSSKVPGVEWTTLVYHDEAPQFAFERQIPRICRNALLRRLFAWFLMVRNRRNYDYILYRYVNSDPFVYVFGGIIRNRISVHHTKELEELRLRSSGVSGFVSGKLESICGSFSVRSAKAVLAVTDEIRKYQLERQDKDKESYIYCNGIIPSEISTLADRRDPAGVNAAFVSGIFSAWHGLDLLISELAKPSSIELAINAKLKVHLVGQLTNEHILRISEISGADRFIKIHGHLTAEEYLPILEESDIGMGSLAMHRIGLGEGATLKVREYLAMGLPVYSGHKDVAFDDSFSFYRCGSISLPAIINFAHEMKSSHRSEVRNHAIEFIDKANLMAGVTRWLASLN